MGAKQDILQLSFKENIALGLEFIPIDDKYTRENKKLHQPHRAAFYLIFWFKGGSPVHMVDFHAVTPPQDSFLFVRKDAVQFFDQHNAFNSSVLLFTDTFFCENDSDNRLLQSSLLFNNFSGQGPEPVPATGTMRDIWQQMQTEDRLPADAFHAALLRKYLHSFILLAERELGNQGKSTRLQGINFEHLVSFKNLLEQHFREEKAVSFYADKLFISTKVLTNVTHLLLGKTPKQLIDERVLLEAKRLLVHSPEPVKNIGIDLGIEEATNFNKFFKRHAGQTPASFRQVFFKG
jgi:AraC family transcriptional activator of pobA